MSLAAGRRVGPYEVIAPLGAGGMGEVWRARDPRLDRDVAIKVLPTALASDPERRARFEREGRLLASLNHPHVAAVLGLEDAGDAPALVMELVEGPTLAERLAKDGAMELAEALALARQVAEAVEYAHERGIVHRDLKPGNVKLTPEGVVKVLDFGLAKALSLDEASPSSPQITQSPTRSVGTQAGILLGTAAYMAPEQARGKAVDRRADIWAFGVVLYEMLAGRQLFAGETVSDTIARILERQPDWGALPGRTPVRVRELLRRCLEKDPRQRLRDMGDARLELEAAIAALASGRGDAPAGAAPGGRVRRAALVAAVALATLAGGWALRGALAPGEPAVRRLSIVPPADLVVRAVLFSADGRTLYASGARRGSTAASARGIWRRDLDRFEWKRIAGTEGSSSWDESHDGRWIYVVQPVAEDSRQRELRRVPVDGSAPAATVLPWSDAYHAWELLPDGRVLVVERECRRFAVLSPGAPGAPAWRELGFDRAITDLTLEQSLADGRTVLATVGYYAPASWLISSATLDVESGKLTVLEENTGSPRLLGGDRLLLTRGGVVLAARWHARGRRLATRPVAVLEGLRTDQAWSAAILTASASGHLGYAPGAAVARQRSLAIVRPDGRVEPWSDARSAFEQTPVATPDGRFALATDVPPGSALYQIVIVERGRPDSRRFAFAEGEDCRGARIAPNGREVIYVRGGVDSTAGIWLAPLDGSAPARRVLPARNVTSPDQPHSWYPDGRSFLVLSRTAQDRRILRRVTPGADSASAVEVVHESYDVDDADVSPDGTRIAYLSEESGEQRVVAAALRPDGRAGDAVPVSRVAGTHPRWADNSTLLWSTPDLQVMGATVSPTLDVSAPQKRFDLGALVNNAHDFAPLPGGSLLITRKADGEGEIRQLDVVLGYRSELERTLRRALGGGR